MTEFVRGVAAARCWVDPRGKVAIACASPLYTVTNPPGTVSVTVYLNGRIHHVELAPALARMTERELAEEVRVIAELARQRARSELHALLIERVRMMGHARGHARQPDS